VIHIKDIRSTFSKDKEFSKYFASRRWTQGLHGRRPNLLSDVAFKHIIGDVFGKEFLAALVAAALGKKVSGVEILSTHVKAFSYLFDRQVWLDILANVGGVYTNIEIQLLLEKYYDLRCFLQTCAIMSNASNDIYQAMKTEGETKIRHDDLFSKIPKFISINFLGFYVDEADAGYRWDFIFRDKTRPERSAIPEVEIIFIELPKFWKQFRSASSKDMKTDLERWLYFYVMCDERGKLEDFLDHNDKIFLKYEERIEEVSKMENFVERYENSTFFKLMAMVMTPEEERDSYKEERDSYKAELESVQKELESKNKEIERLRKDLESAKNNSSAF
jgi:hypothetical protein